MFSIVVLTATYVFAIKIRFMLLIEEKGLNEFPLSGSELEISLQWT